MLKSITQYLSEGPLIYARNIAISTGLGAGIASVMNAASGQQVADVPKSAAISAGLSSVFNLGHLVNKETPVVQKLEKTPSANKKDIPKGKKQDIIKNT